MDIDWIKLWKRKMKNDLIIIIFNNLSKKTKTKQKSVKTC